MMVHKFYILKNKPFICLVFQEAGDVGRALAPKPHQLSDDVILPCMHVYFEVFNEMTHPKPINAFLQHMLPYQISIDD